MVLASGSGSNFQAILDAIQHGTVDAQVSALIANRDGIGAISKANQAGIPTHIISPKAYTGESEFATALLDCLNALQPDLIVLAGYLVKVPREIIRHYAGKIINIHPSLLPLYGGKGFYGIRVHEAVLADGAAQSGCTVHIVTEEFDEGPILAQRVVSVTPDETPVSLAAKVLEQEHQLLPETIQRYLHP